jgi:hypothetical protein
MGVETLKTHDEDLEFLGHKLTFINQWLVFANLWFRSNSVTGHVVGIVYVHTGVHIYIYI